MGLDTLPEQIGQTRGNFVTTYTGLRFHLLDPTPDEISLLDIAHALSNQCRYGGHCPRFYSVAEHCVLVSKYVSPENALWGLMHDASEAYLVDVPRPLKPYLTNYKTVENKILEVIAKKYDLPWPIPHEVHVIDNKLLGTELRQLWKKSPDWIDEIPELDRADPILCLDPVRAKEVYKRRYRAIMKKLAA